MRPWANRLLALLVLALALALGVPGHLPIDGAAAAGGGGPPLPAMASGPEPAAGPGEAPTTASAPSVCEVNVTDFCRCADPESPLCHWQEDNCAHSVGCLQQPSWQCLDLQATVESVSLESCVCLGLTITLIWGVCHRLAKWRGLYVRDGPGAPQPGDAPLPWRARMLRFDISLFHHAADSAHVRYLVQKGEVTMLSMLFAMNLAIQVFGVVLIPALIGLGLNLGNCAPGNDLLACTSVAGLANGSFWLLAGSCSLVAIVLLIRSVIDSHSKRFLEVLEDGVRQSLRRFPLLDGRFEVEGETPPLASSSQPQSPQGPLLPVPHVLEGSPEGSPADDPRTAAPPSQMRRRSHRKTPTSTPSHAAHSPSRGDSAAETPPSAQPATAPTPLSDNPRYAVHAVVLRIVKSPSIAIAASREAVASTLRKRAGRIDRLIALGLVGQIGPIPVLYLLGYALLGVASFLFPPVIWLPGVVVTAATLLLRWLRGLLWSASMRRPGLRDTLVQMQLSDADACEAALRDALPQDKASFTLLYGKKEVREASSKVQRLRQQLRTVGGKPPVSPGTLERGGASSSPPGKKASKGRQLQSGTPAASSPTRSAAVQNLQQQLAAAEAELAVVAVTSTYVNALPHAYVVFRRVDDALLAVELGTLHSGGYEFSVEPAGVKGEHIRPAMERGYLPRVVGWAICLLVALAAIFLPFSAFFCLQAWLVYQWCGPAARVKAVAFGSAQAFALLTNGTALVVGGCEAAAGGDAPRHLPAVCTAWWGVIAITLLNLVGLALTRAFVYVLMPKLYHKLLLRWGDFVTSGERETFFARTLSFWQFAFFFAMSVSYGALANWVSLLVANDFSVALHMMGQGWMAGGLYIFTLVLVEIFFSSPLRRVSPGGFGRMWKTLRGRPRQVEEADAPEFEMAEYADHLATLLFYLAFVPTHPIIAPALLMAALEFYWHTRELTARTFRQGFEAWGAPYCLALEAILVGVSMAFFGLAFVAARKQVVVACLPLTAAAFAHIYLVLTVTNVHTRVRRVFSWVLRSQPTQLSVQQRQQLLGEYMSG